MPKALPWFVALYGVESRVDGAKLDVGVDDLVTGLGTLDISRRA